MQAPFPSRFSLPKKRSFVCRVGWPAVLLERLERGGPCRLLKLRQMGTQRVQNERGPLFCSSCQYKRFLCCFGCPSRPSTKYFFPHRTQFQLICPHCSASWEGSRKGSPVSYPMWVSGPPPPISPHHQKFIIKAPLLHPIGSYNQSMHSFRSECYARLYRQLEKQSMCYTERRKTTVREK